MAPVPPRLIDIGSNLSDPVFKGHYHKQIHANDLELVLLRARNAGVQQQILTGDSLTGASEVLQLAKSYSGLVTTVGCHPCRAGEFDAHPDGPTAYLAAMSTLIQDNLGGKHGTGKVVAVGECGLDYDRLNLCDRATQLRHFAPQLCLATRFDLPLFLHSRAAHADFVATIKAHGTPLRGVVHSHTGTLEEALELIELGFFIGINGCSLKTEENLACVRQLPLRSILLESDCPWCEIRPSHASCPLLATLPDHLRPLYLPPSFKKEKWRTGATVKGRNEPCATGLVAWIVSQLHGTTLETVAETTWENTISLFGLAVPSSDLNGSFDSVQ